MHTKSPPILCIQMTTLVTQPAFDQQSLKEQRREHCNKIKEEAEGNATSFKMLLYLRGAIIISPNQGTKVEQQNVIKEMIEKYVNFEGSHHGEIPQSPATLVVTVDFFEEVVHTGIPNNLPAAEATPVTVEEDTTTDSSTSVRDPDRWVMVNDPKEEWVVCLSNGRELYRTKYD
jgi:hypothetical protein